MIVFSFKKSFLDILICFGTQNALKSVSELRKNGNVWHDAQPVWSSLSDNMTVLSSSSVWVTKSHFQIWWVGYQARSAGNVWVFLEINLGKLQYFSDVVARRRRKNGFRNIWRPKKYEIHKLYLKNHYFSCFPIKKYQKNRALRARFFFYDPSILVQVYEEDQISHTHKQAMQNSH